MNATICEAETGRRCVDHRGENTASKVDGLRGEKSIIDRIQAQVSAGVAGGLGTSRSPRLGKSQVSGDARRLQSRNTEQRERRGS